MGGLKAVSDRMSRRPPVGGVYRPDTEKYMTLRRTETRAAQFCAVRLPDALIGRLLTAYPLSEAGKL